MTLVQAAAGFAGLALVVTLVPGLDTALVLRTAVVDGRGRAFAAAAGVSAGVLVWGATAAVGLAALLAASRLVYDVVRFAGAAYLLYLGVRLLVGAIRGREHATAPRAAHGLGRSFRTGLLTNLLNPKVGVFYLAALPQFLVPGVPAVAMGLLLAGVHVAFGTAWLALLTLLASRAAAVLRRPRVVRAIDGSTGAVMIGFGIRAALERP